MILDCYLSDKQLYQAFYQLNAKINQIACISITDPTEPRDQLEQDIIDYFYQQKFDALYGGLLLQHKPQSEVTKQSILYKPIYLNLCFSQLFLLAGLQLNNGEIINFGLQIADYFAAKNDTSDRLLDVELKAEKPFGLQHQGYYTMQDLACYFSLAAIKSLTQGDESRLIQALMSPVTKDNQDWLYCKKQNLAAAAGQISMPLKQAQILEAELFRKFQSAAQIAVQRQSKATAKPIQTKALDDPIRVNSQLVITLSLASFCSRSSRYQQSARRVLMQLFAQPSLKVQQRIGVLHAALYYLQADFDRNIVQLFERTLVHLARAHHHFDFSKGPAAQQREFAAVYYFVKALRLSEQGEQPLINWLSHEQALKAMFGVDNALDNIAIEVLDRSKPDCDRQLTQLKANHSQQGFIFVV